MNTFYTICQVTGVLLLVAAIISMLVIALNRPAKCLLSLIILVFFCGCRGHICIGKDCSVYKDHDTGTYYIYRAINLRTGHIQPAKVDTFWNVYQATDTVFLDKAGFIASTARDITDTVQLGICTGIVTLQDDTLILSGHAMPKDNLGTAD